MKARVDIFNLVFRQLPVCSIFHKSQGYLGQRRLLGTVLIWPICLILGVIITNTASASGIPEPSLIYYGTIRNTARFNARVTSGTLSWQIRQPDTLRTITLTTAVSNVLDRFSYVLMVPCETRSVATASANAPIFDPSQVSVDGRPVAFRWATVTIINRVAPPTCHRPRLATTATSNTEYS